MALTGKVKPKITSIRNQTTGSAILITCQGAVLETIRTAESARRETRETT